MENYNQYSTDELREIVNSLRLNPEFSWVTKELKQEAKDIADYCHKRRKQNWKSSGAQGVSKSGIFQERMKLPRLVEFHVEYRFGKVWRKDKSAWKYLWDKFPQYRLIENRGKNPYG